MYQVFISYRRDGGEMLAMHLAHRLREKGITVFFDVETMRSGKFNEQIFNVIDDCGAFLLILTKNCLDRCGSPSDWVRLEIEHALKMKKNIIPIFGRDFEFPDVLPGSIDEIRYCNGIHANTEFFDAVVERIISLSGTKAVPEQSAEQQDRENKTEFLSLAEADYSCLVELSISLRTADQEKFLSAIGPMEAAMRDTLFYCERRRFSAPEESKAAKKIIDMYNEFLVPYNQFASYPMELRGSDEWLKVVHEMFRLLDSLIEFIAAFL